MSFSRFSVLAVFLMMVLSAFVTVPTYNVGADEGGCIDYDDENGNGAYDEGEPCHDDDGDDNPPGEGEGCMDYDDENGNGAYDEGEPCYDDEDECPFDADNPDSPCNADECMDHESSECYDFVMNYCDTNYDTGCDYMHGEPDGADPENFYATMTMESLEDWHVSYFGEMPVEWSNNVREDLAEMCSDMDADAGGSEISVECFNHWLDNIMAEEDGEHHEDECPPGLTDEQCNALRDCFENSSDSGMLSCWRMMYDICVDDDSFEFCNEDEDREFFNNIFAYEDGLMDPEDFMSAVIDEIDSDGDYNEPAIYDHQHFTINEGDEGIYRLYSEFFPGSTPNFICGDGTEVPFWSVNDGYEDCEDGADEQQYEEDNTTKINWFDCHDGSEVWIDQVNNGDWDCKDGEDEYQVFYWWGRAYLIEGHQNYPDEFTHNLITGAGYHCDWKDADEVEVDCSEYAEAYLSAGDYTLLTTGTCYDEWTDEDEDGEDDFNMLSCNNHGFSNHTLKNIDGVVHNFHSEIEPWDFVEETLMEMTEEYWDDEWHGSSNFPLYDTYSFVLDTSVDGDVTITSSQWQCYDWDEDGEDDDCWGADLALYLYEESFDPADPHANIIASNDGYYDDNFDCPSEGGDCSQSALQVILNQGVTYVVVTAGFSTDEGLYLNNIISEGDIIESWDGELLASHYAWNDTTNESYVVPGDDRAHLPYPWEYETGSDKDGTDDEGYEFYMNILDIIDAYESGEMDASESADAFVDLMYEADEAGLFSDDYEDDDGDYVYWNEYSYCEWVSESLDGDYDWGDDRWYCEENASEGFEDWWYYCEMHDDGFGGSNYFCTDDFGQHPSYEHSAGNTHYVDGGWPDHEEYEDDNPALLDGIEGVEDEDNEPMPQSENIVGPLSDNEDTPMLFGTSFNIHFEGVDESLSEHSLYIPIGEDGENWNVAMDLLEGYEVISCDTCEDLEIDGSSATFRGNEPVTITFGMTEPLPDCDHVVGLDSTGYAFEPADLTINVGETVCWQWEGAADVHNVLELESEFDADMNLTAVNVGFFSGEPSNTVDFRHTFTEDSMTHYYVCEPHATMGMVGKITVGEGSDEDPVEEIVEEAGLPSVGFVVSVLALIGVTGLRRRIH